MAYTVVIYGWHQVDPEFPLRLLREKKAIFARSVIDPSTMACNFESRVSQISTLMVCRNTYLRAQFCLNSIVMLASAKLGPSTGDHPCSNVDWEGSFRSGDALFLYLCGDFLQPENKKCIFTMHTATSLLLSRRFGWFYCNQFFINWHCTS